MQSRPLWIGGIEVVVVEADVLDCNDVDALVLCGTLLPLTIGIRAFRLELIGGQALVEECRVRSSASDDGVLVTAPYGRARLGLIHVPGEVPARHPMRSELLESAYRRAFQAAATCAYHTLAVEPLYQLAPALSDDAAGRSVSRLLERDSASFAPLQMVRFVFQEEQRARGFMTGLGSPDPGAQPPSQERLQ